ncbi:uncharacterized protein LOC111079811 [Drosophila obscura]|uniref:uncharacterized protein LOC111079811 n=1 Tax=Drosophila obscura TaxID=7282 RepID=UPI001BB2B54A|nr:uncharacterized protein LOC111079811 [Drosophila obscura]
MRLFVLGLLALGSVQAFSVVRTIQSQPQPQPHPQLLAYAPSRGEFPVVSGLAQGYVRYLDGTGAERLLAYNYPEPLNGIRASPSLLRSGLAEEQQDTALFRAWCEQRYNVMRLELERLRAQGLKPSPQMMAQFEPLEQIVKFAAFDAVPGLSPEVQRARDEHLRIWNEARLEVLRAEQAQQIMGHYQPQEDIVQVKATPKDAIPVIYGQQIKIAQAVTPQTHSYGQFVASPQNPFLVKAATISGYTGTSNETPRPVEETPEVKLAREEHLKQFNEALHRQPAAAPEIPILKTIPGIQQPQPIASYPQANIKTVTYGDQQAPQPVEETPEVKLAREEHLKQFNEALLRQPAEEPILKTTSAIQQPLFNQPQAIIETPQPVEETPEVKLAREEHLKQFNEAILRQPIDQQQQPLIPTAPFAPLPNLKTIYPSQQGPQPIQYTPEVKRAREQHLILLGQAKVKAEDQVADIDDLIRLEERERDQENLREKERQEIEKKEAALERLREEERISQETRLLQAERLKIEEEDRQRLYAEQLELKNTPSYDTETPTDISSPIFLDAAQGNIKLLASQPAPAPAQPQTQISSQQQSVQNGFFLRIHTNQPNAIPTATATTSGPTFVYPDNTPNPFLVRYTEQLQQPLPVLPQGLKETHILPSAANAVELATREHLRAHEIALEQLRLANLKNPWNPDCNH